MSGKLILLLALCLMTLSGCAPIGDAHRAPLTVTSNHDPNAEADQILLRMRSSDSLRGQLVWSYVQALSECDQQKQSTGSEVISDFAADPNVPAELVNGLRESTPAQTKIASFMLSEICEQTALPETCRSTAIYLLKHGDPSVRSGLRLALEQSARLTRDTSIMAALIESSSSDSSGDIRVALVEALGRLGDGNGRNDVFNALKRSASVDKDVRVQAAAVMALSSSPSLRKSHGKEILSLVESGLASPKSVIRKESLEAACRFGRDSSCLIPSLIAVLDKPNEKMGTGSSHSFAARSLGAMGPMAASSVPALRTRIHEPGVTDQVLVALGQIGPAAGQAVPDVIPFCRDDDMSTRSFALDALALMGNHSRPALPVLQEMLATPSQIDKLRLRQVINKIESST